MGDFFCEVVNIKIKLGIGILGNFDWLCLWIFKMNFKVLKMVLLSDMGEDIILICFFELVVVRFVSIGSWMCVIVLFWVSRWDCCWIDVVNFSLVFCSKDFMFFWLMWLLFINCDRYCIIRSIVICVVRYGMLL